MAVEWALLGASVVLVGSLGFAFWFGMKFDAAGRDVTDYKNALDLQIAITKVFLKITHDDEKTKAFLDRVHTAQSAADIDRLYEEHLHEA